jgi:hypothetical protein
MNSRNVGRFKIKEQLIRDHPEKVAGVFKIIKCVPVRVEYSFHDKSYEYTAIAEPFDKIEDGSMVPFYELSIQCDIEAWPECIIVRKYVDHY